MLTSLKTQEAAVKGSPPQATSQSLQHPLQALPMPGPPPWWPPPRSRPLPGLVCPRHHTLMKGLSETWRRPWPDTCPMTPQTSPPTPFWRAGEPPPPWTTPGNAPPFSGWAMPAANRPQHSQPPNSWGNCTPAGKVWSGPPCSVLTTLRWDQPFQLLLALKVTRMLCLERGMTFLTLEVVWQPLVTLTTTLPWPRPQVCLHGKKWQEIVVICVEHLQVTLVMVEAYLPNLCPSSHRYTLMDPQGCLWTHQPTPPPSQTKLDSTRPPVFTFTMQIQQNPPHPMTAYVLGVHGTLLRHSNNFLVKAPLTLTSASTCTATVFISKVLVWSGCVSFEMPTVWVLWQFYSYRDDTKAEMQLCSKRYWLAL